MGAAIQVHRELGPGFVESVHQKSLEIELRERGISFEPQKSVEVRYSIMHLGSYILASFAPPHSRSYCSNPYYCWDIDVGTA
nr:GxxExxY protein [Oscillatoria sp. PCC 10802]